MNNKIHQGGAWYDTTGNRIQAHGGSILKIKDTYYWYGENKELTVPGSNIWQNGVNCYSSRDFTNWKFENTILKSSDDPDNPLHPTRIMDRPHIIFNEATQTYVMWMKLVGTKEEPHNWNYQYMGIATAKHITDDFKLVNKIVPLGMSSGDFDLFVDDNQKAYLIFGKVHTEIIVADLTKDYLNVTGDFTSHLHFIGPPIAREAPAVFKVKDKYYLFTSGTTGYYPNPTLLAVSDNIHGPWYIAGNPIIDDLKKDSFNCQFSSVFHDTDTHQLVAIGDRWVPDQNATVEKSSWNINTSLSEYVWLPISFGNEGLPEVIWQDDWNMNDL
ncbi:family 43 glycosylhydrolase [Companilactobacillus sp. FL22-1]|uniref:family 43 glycosylhydrolase n=1 Tax=Companilactobacillus sp. FL22-1 TaxID=3373892 RepID=UPI0037544D5B